MSKHYRVIWELDIEGETINNPTEAVNDCWKRLQEHGNDWIWKVLDIDTDEVFDVDYELCEEDGQPKITKISNGLNI